jgi:hypothetical protein
MTATTHTQMHSDHRKWRSEDDLWRLEIAEWQQEIAAALIDLQKLGMALCDHEKALEVHAAAVRACEQTMLEHEHAIADEQKRDGALAGVVAQTEGHQGEAQHHAAQRAAHERLKKHHHTLMARWNVLKQALIKPM